MQPCAICVPYVVLLIAELACLTEYTTGLSITSEHISFVKPESFAA